MKNYFPIVVLALLTLTRASRAEEILSEPGIHVGVMGGAAFITALEQQLGGFDPKDVSFTLATRVGYAPNAEWSYGIYGQWLHLLHVEPVGAAEVDFRIWSVMAEANYHVASFYAGGKIGAGIFDGSGAVSEIRLAAGPTIGVHHPLATDFSLIGEANWIYHVSADGFSTLSVMAGVQFGL